MIYIIGAIIGVLAIFNKRNRFVFFLIALYGFSIFAFNTENPDLVNYQNQYIGRFFGFTEPIYIFLASVSKFLGLDFWLFRGMIASVGMCLVCKTIYDYSPYPNLCLFLYVLYPLVIDVVQIRFFWGYSIIVFSIRYIIEYRKTKKLSCVFGFFVSIIVATGMHYSAIMYIVLIILLLNVEKHRIIIYIVIPMIIVLLFSNLASLAGFASSFLGDWKINRWLYGDKDPTLMNAIRIIISRSSLLIIPCLFAVMANKQRKFYIHELETNNQWEKENLIIESKTNTVFFLASLYVELYCLLEITVASEYERVTRPALVWTGILATRLLYRMKLFNRYIGKLVWILLIVLYFSSQMFFQGVKNTNLSYFDYVFRQIMENNTLFP